MTSLIRSKITIRRPASLSVQLADAVRKLIEDGEIKPGDKLPSEQDLMETYNVSRTVVREAISSLKAEHLVSTHQGVGAFVLQTVPVVPYRIARKDLDAAKDLIELLELRVGIESETAALAALRRTPEQMEAISRAFTELRVFIVGSASDHIAPDYDFHLAIAKASNNHYFSYLFSHFGPKLIPRASLKGFTKGPKRDAYFARIAEEHDAIYQSILRQDPEAARAAMRVHLVSALERMRLAYSEQNDSGEE